MTLVYSMTPSLRDKKTDNTKEIHLLGGFELNKEPVTVWHVGNLPESASARSRVFQDIFAFARKNIKQRPAGGIVFIGGKEAKLCWESQTLRWAPCAMPSAIVAFKPIEELFGRAA